MERSSLYKKSSPVTQPPGNFFGKKKEASFFSPAFIQPRLTIGPADDPYEREADAVADKVMRMSDTETLQTKISPVSVQRKCAACEEEEKAQMKSDHNLIQRQSKDDENDPTTPPVPDPDNEWDKKYQLKLSGDLMDNAALNTALRFRGVPRPGDYTDEAEAEFKRQVEFYKYFKWGNTVKNLNKVPVLKLIVPDLEGNDPDIGLANKTLPVAVGSGLWREYPSIEEKNETGPVFPIYDWKF